MCSFHCHIIFCACTSDHMRCLQYVLHVTHLCSCTQAKLRKRKPSSPGLRALHDCCSVSLTAAVHAHLRTTNTQDSCCVTILSASQLQSRSPCCSSVGRRFSEVLKHIMRYAAASTKVSGNVLRGTCRTVQERKLPGASVISAGTPSFSSRWLTNSKRDHCILPYIPTSDGLDFHVARKPGRYTVVASKRVRWLANQDVQSSSNSSHSDTEVKSLNRFPATDLACTDKQ